MHSFKLKDENKKWNSPIDKIKQIRQIILREVVIQKIKILAQEAGYVGLKKDNCMISLQDIPFGRNKQK